MHFAKSACRALIGAGVSGAAMLLVAGCSDAGREEGDWRSQMGQIRSAMTASEEDPRMTEGIGAYRNYLEKATGLPVRMYESGSHNGAIQALSSGQADFVFLPAASYANVDAQIGDKAAPILAVRGVDGEMGYYSALIVKASSPYHRFEDLRGKTIGYVDFNSTSGYLYPRKRMREMGFNPDNFFGRVALAGGHTQAVMALGSDQFDATIINVGGGTPETGFTSGSLVTLARRGLIDLDDFRTLLTVGPMPQSSVIIRTDRPKEFQDLIRGALAALPYDEPDVWRSMGRADGASLTGVTREYYREVIDLRNEELVERRLAASGQVPE